MVGIQQEQKTAGTRQVMNFTSFTVMHTALPTERYTIRVSFMVLQFPIKCRVV